MTAAQKINAEQRVKMREDSREHVRQIATYCREFVELVRVVIPPRDGDPTVDEMISARLMAEKLRCAA